MNAPPSRPRVLVAEDDSALRKLLDLRLTVDGYEVKTVPDGAEALSTLQKWLPDVLVCDIMMPRVSGLSVCRALREKPSSASMPIVLLTARCMDRDIEDVLKLGGITFMNKPFDAAQLNWVIRSVLESGRSAG